LDEVKWWEAGWVERRAIASSIFPKSSGQKIRLKVNDFTTS